jgi:hypothetical protein
VHDLGSATAPRSLAPETPGIGTSTLTGAKLKTLAVGALVGSAATAALLFGAGLVPSSTETTADAPTEISTVVPMARSAAPSEAEATSAPSASQVAPDLNPVPAQQKQEPPEVASVRTKPDEPARTWTPTVATTDDAARLAEEVKHLDWIRRLGASGSHREVLRSVGKYHERFPRGELAPEAEVLALQSLVALKQRDRVTERADAFARRYPHSPHLRRVEDWAKE